MLRFLSALSSASFADSLRHTLFASIDTPKSFCTRSFYRRDVIDFENNIEVVYRLVVALEASLQTAFALPKSEDGG